MTKEQIEKEAKAECFMLTVNTIGIDQRDVELAYILGRNKSIEQIEALKKENKELKTVKIPQLERRIASIRGCHSVDAKKLNARIEQVERLKQENAELKAQIEKMKCCGNCAKNGHICVAEEMQGELCGKNKDKWELRRVNKWQ